MKIRDMPQAVQYRKYALQLVDAPLGYEYGKENPMGSDCSGLLSYPLLRMGWRIRTTAQEFYDKIFVTNISSTVHPLLDVDMCALFFVSRKAWYRPNGIRMEKGTAYHCAPLVGEGVVIHADSDADKIYLIETVSLIADYNYLGYDVRWRRITKGALEQYDGVLVAGLDEELEDTLKLIDRGLTDE